MELSKCYRVLGVNHDATLKEIKKTFRNKIKSCHPDSNSAKTIDSPAIISELTEAYHTIEIRRKTSSDFLNEKVEPKQNNYVFDYLQFLYERQDRFEYQVKLYTFDLLYRNGNDAVRLYYSFQKKDKIDRLMDELGYHDYYDYLFLLSERLEDDNSTNHKKRAMKYYFELCSLESRQAYFREYFSEVLYRMKRLFYIDPTFLAKREISRLRNLIPNFKISNALKKYYLDIFCC